jgi:hypothetical protein
MKKIDQTKKIELSEPVSNLLLVSSVLLAFTPLLLGDQLLMVVTGTMKDCVVMIDQFATFLTGLLS